jgi:hypothetical protein
MSKRRAIGLPRTVLYPLAIVGVAVVALMAPSIAETVEEVVEKRFKRRRKKA